MNNKQNSKSYSQNAYITFMEKHRIKQNKKKTNNDSNAVSNVASATEDTTTEQKINTHTRMFHQEPLYAGSFYIPPEDRDLFLKLYYDFVFVKNNSEYLTERHSDPNTPYEYSPIVIDIDFRYDYSVMERLHDEDTISNLIMMYLDKIYDIFDIQEGDSFPIYVLEKDAPFRDEKHKVTKDGIHFIFGISCNKFTKEFLYDAVKEYYPQFLKTNDDFKMPPFINSIDDLFDRGCMIGSSGWQAYGSKKEANLDSYKLTFSLIAKRDVGNQYIDTKDTIIQKGKIIPFDEFVKISSHYTGFKKFDINPQIKKIFEERELQTKKKLARKSNIIITTQKIQEEEISHDDPIEILEIENQEMLDIAIEQMLESIPQNKEFIKDAHYFALILPDKYYKPGSHVLNRKVAFALKNTDERLFLTWVKLRSYADDFDYNDIPRLYDLWENYFNKRDSNETANLTKKSLLYWARIDADPEDFRKVQKNSVDQLLDAAILTKSDWDFACILHTLYKDSYISVVYNKKSTWFRFEKHKWVEDNKNSLSILISTTLVDLVNTKLQEYQSCLKNFEAGSEQHKILSGKIRAASDVIKGKLKMRAGKSGIIGEAENIFNDTNFIEMADSNPYLLCFNNGVFDFKENVFRAGNPQDYLTKCTKIDYIPLNPDEHKSKIDEINQYMSTLFPIDGIRKYMWQHLAASLIGVKTVEAIFIYRGSGSNGKSVLNNFIKSIMGSYYVSVPVQLYTNKRNQIGGTSSEIALLRNARMATSVEPSKGEELNEGVMKQLTGGDPLQARELYAPIMTFVPQCSFTISTNSLFDVKSNDDGTWRRIKIIDFVSKICKKGEKFTDGTKYVFEADVNLLDKIGTWKEVFMSMLIEICKEKKGVIDYCKEVDEASNKYRGSQDYISQFIENMIIREEGAKLGITGLNSAFKLWWNDNGLSGKMPKMNEIHDKINISFGDQCQELRSNKKYWKGITIKQSADEEEDDVIEQIV